jgi:hypothetical protein
MRSADEDLALKTICKSAEYVAHYAAWQDAYRIYRRRRGNEFGIDDTVFPDDVALKQKGLYENRRSNPFFTALREAVHPCCSRCGCPMTGHLDHHLPEAAFREFAVLPANLVPTCGSCNSGLKQDKGIGSVWPQRFLHPYYDRYARKALWRVAIKNQVAFDFMPVPEPTLRPRLTELVRYNLDNLLGWQFRNNVANHWKALPGSVAKWRKLISEPYSGIEPILGVLLVTAVASEGLNGWKAALLRGILSDQSACAHVDALARNLPEAL